MTRLSQTLFVKCWYMYYARRGLIQFINPESVMAEVHQPRESPTGFAHHMHTITLLREQLQGYRHHTRIFMHSFFDKKIEIEGVTLNKAPGVFGTSQVIFFEYFLM